MRSNGNGRSAVAPASRAARAEIARPGSASEARYRALFESTDEGFQAAEVLFDDDGRAVDLYFLESNPAATRMVGADYTGRRLSEVDPAADAFWLELFGRVARTGAGERLERRDERSDRWFDFYTFRVGEHRDREVAVVFADVTERKRREIDAARTAAALRESEARFRAIANVVPDLLWESAADGSTTWFNDRWYEYTGQAPAEPLGDGWLRAIHPDDRAGSGATWLAAVREKCVAIREHRIRGADGCYRWFLVRAEPLRDQEGRVLCWLGAATDVHERRLAFGEVERRVAERTAELARSDADRVVLRRRLLQAEEDERRRLARELHDEAGQQITALALGLQALSDVSVPGSDVDRRAAQLRVLAHTLGHELHDIAVRLRPRALEDFGLVATLEAYAEEWSRSAKIAVDLHVPAEVDGLPAPVESAVYRSVQEALTNVAKHSEATHVSIVVERRDSHVVAVVEDDGRGFDTEAPPAPGRAPSLGLLGVRERAALLGGTVDVESTPSGGTSLFVRIPIAVPGG